MYMCVCVCIYIYICTHRLLFTYNIDMLHGRAPQGCRSWKRTTPHSAKARILYYTIDYTRLDYTILYYTILYYTILYYAPPAR